MTLSHSRFSKIGKGLLGGSSLIYGVAAEVTDAGGSLPTMLVSSLMGLRPHEPWIPLCSLPLSLQGLSLRLRLLPAQFSWFSHIFLCQLAFQTQEPEFPIQLITVTGTGTASLCHMLLVRAVRGSTQCWGCGGISSSPDGGEARSHHRRTHGMGDVSAVGFVK